MSFRSNPALPADGFRGELTGVEESRASLFPDPKGEKKGKCDRPNRLTFGYSNAMRSLSQGRAGSSMEPLGYKPAPPAVAGSFAL